MDSIHAQFLNDTIDFDTDVKLNQGVHRHIEFSYKNSSIHKFMLTTWPGHLCISGDMGTFVFSRLPDMFDFFSSDHLSPTISPGYWAEKLQSVEKNEGYDEWDGHAFRRALKADVKEAAEWNPDFNWKETWWDVKGYLGRGESATEDDDMRRVYDIPAHIYEFSDMWEMGCRKFTGRYLWCCWAIAYGVRWAQKATKDE